MEADFKTSIGAKMREARTAARMTQDDVAMELRRSRQAISSWEAGRTAPSLEEFRDLTALYGVSADHMLCGVNVAAIFRGVLSLGRKERPQFADSAL